MDLLDQLGITYIREKSFDGLVGDSGRGLRFDFVLSKSSDKDGKPIFDLAIELQGPHHYKKVIMMNLELMWQKITAMHRIDLIGR